MNEENNTIYHRVTLNPMKIRQAATLNMNGCWWLYSIGIFIYYILLDVIINIVSLYFPSGYLSLDMSQMSEELQQYVSSGMKIPVLLLLYTLLMSGALILGRTIYTLMVLRNRVAIPRAMFEGFSGSGYFKALLIYILREFLIGIGLMCFVIPGIILAYSYRQVFFALAENGDRSVLECFRESRRMMVGNKMTAFQLDLMYLPPILISYLPSYLLGSYGIADTTTLGGILLYYLVQVPYFMTMGNYYMGQTVFYELILYGRFCDFKYQGEDFFRKIDQSNREDFTNGDE